MIAVRTMSFTLALIAMLPASVVGAQSYPNEIALGQALFQDKNLSANRSVACASCHQPDHGFADTRTVSLGVRKQPGTRNAPSLLDLGEYHSFFWDGRAATLAQQASVPFLAPNELGFKNLAQVVARVQQNPRYVAAFQALSGRSDKSIEFDDIATALIAYERSLGSSPNGVDRYLGGDQAALSPTAQQGLALFRGPAHCAECHLIIGTSAPLTDNRFHSSGIGLAAVSPELAKLAQQVAALPRAARYVRIESDPRWAALGRYLVTLDPKDIGRFRTPSLRNVALTAPYMHDGSVATLVQAVNVELYYRGLKLGHAIMLSVEERHDLLAFLQSLSSGYSTVSRSSPVSSVIAKNSSRPLSGDSTVLRNRNTTRNPGRGTP